MRFGTRVKLGFTMIEMTVVIGIIVVLTALSMPQVMNFQERSDLAGVAQSVSQMVVDAKTMTFAPIVDKDGGSYSMYAVRFASGISKEKPVDLSFCKTGTAECKIHPVELLGWKENSIGSLDYTKADVLKTMDFPDMTTIKEISPVVGGDEDIDAGSGIKVYSVQFYLTDSKLTFGKNKVSDSDGAWNTSTNLEILLNDERLNHLKKDSSQPEKMYVHINKYSGQVWTSRESEEESSGKKVTLPQSDAVDDYYTDGTGNKVEDFIKVDSSSNTGYVSFSMAYLGTVKHDAFPKRARLYLTVDSVSNGGGTSPPLIVKLLNPDGSAELGEVGTLTNIKSKSVVFVDFNIAKYSAAFKPSGSYDFSNAINFKIVADSGAYSGANAQFYSSRWEETSGAAILDDGSGDPMVARPGPYLELFY